MPNYQKLAEEFLNNLFNEVKQTNLCLRFKEIDHICFRTDSLEDYLRVCQDFSDHELLIESMVNGRLISTFKLNTPYQYQNFQIPLIEIPAPKVGKIVKRGFEHIELVVEDSFEDLMTKYHDYKLDLSGLGKKINPELEMILNNGSIKFHHQSLNDVIHFEKGQS